MKLKGIDENTAVHCPTEELSEKVLKIAKEAGCSPFLVNSMYCHYEKDTCYNLMNGTFSDIRYYKNIKDYTILPAEEFIKLNTMKQLPEKWAIKGEDLPQEFYDWLEKKGLFAAFKYEDDKLSTIYYPSAHDISNHEEINIEQWREAVKQEKELDHDTDSILPEDESKAKFIQETGELIGYEAPYDIPKWNTKKGDLWTYTKNGWYEFNDESLPAEWVETWKPVCKSKEKKRVVKSSIDVHENGKLWGVFQDKKTAVIQVKAHGKLGCTYTYHEVDHITEG